jgi:hypothetical protein
MAIQLTEKEAAEFFAKIGRSAPLTARQIHDVGVNAVRDYLRIEIAATKAVAKALAPLRPG